MADIERGGGRKEKAEGFGKGMSVVLNYSIICKSIST